MSAPTPEALAAMLLTDLGLALDRALDRCTVPVRTVADLRATHAALGEARDIAAEILGRGPELDAAIAEALK